jgi:hypothetical protein
MWLIYLLIWFLGMPVVSGMLKAQNKYQDGTESSSGAWAVWVIFWPIAWLMSLLYNFSYKIFKK